MMIEHKIGEIFMYGNVLLKVEKKNVPVNCVIFQGD